MSWSLNLELGIDISVVTFFRKILGEVKQAESVLAVQSAKKPSQPKEPAKPKIKDEPKKEAKKDVKKEPVEAAVEEEAPTRKAKNRLDLLPPSKMILDDWKRIYSNTKTNFREVAVKGFWDMYDAEGYSQSLVLQFQVQ